MMNQSHLYNHNKDSYLTSASALKFHFTIRSYFIDPDDPDFVQKKYDRVDEINFKPAPAKISSGWVLMMIIMIGLAQ